MTFKTRSSFRGTIRKYTSIVTISLSRTVSVISTSVVHVITRDLIVNFRHAKCHIIQGCSGYDAINPLTPTVTI